MTLLALGLGVLILVNRFVAHVHRSGEVKCGLLLWAGFLGGLGWWSNQMILVFFAAAVLVILPVLPSVFRKGTVYFALLAFGVGSAPWWWWNLHHDWATFAFGGSFGEVPFREGAALFAGLLPNTLGLDPWPSPLQVGRLAGLTLLVSAAGWWTLRASASLAMDRPQEALVELETARRLVDLGTEALTLLGDLYLERGLVEEAASTYAAAVKGGGGIDVALRAAEAFAALAHAAKARDVLALIPQMDRAVFSHNIRRIG